MASANERIRDQILRHHHYLSRYESTQVKILVGVLNKAHTEILQKIATTKGGWTKTWLNNTLANIDGIYSAAVEGMQGVLFPEMRALAQVEARFASGVLSGITGMTTVAPSPEQLWAAINTNPADRGHTLGQLFESYTNANVDKVQSAIRQAVIEGETVQQLTQRLRGTKAMSYTDGILQASKHGAETLARTSVMHVANQAHLAVYKENADIIKGVQVIATLDTRTCPVCGGLDGKVFDDVDHMPTPPLHPNCRCTITAVTKSYAELAGGTGDDKPTGSRASMDGQVPANMSYGQWLRTQDRATVEDILGKGKAALFLDNGIPIERFVKDGLTLSLEELQNAEGLSVPKPEFQPQNDIAAAAKYAVENDLADMASYKGSSIEVANAWNQSVFEHLQMFPELRSNFKFIGTTQERQRQYVELRVEMIKKEHAAWYNEQVSRCGKDSVDEYLIKKARGEAGKTPSSTYAYATQDVLTKGVCVNSKFASDVPNFKDALLKDVETKWHPIGCDTIKSVIDHEIGHQLDSLLNIRSNSEFHKICLDEFGEGKEMWNKIRDGLSRYPLDPRANMRAEMIAEAWSEYLNNKTPRSFARLVGELIEMEYTKKYGSKS